MRFSRLIALAAQRELQRDPGLVGVRLSPVLLRPADASAVAADAVEVLGKRIHVAISVPSVAYEERDRLLLAPDSRAAERATAWRNTVRIPEGDHILYVSVERHGKAGGLEDCLYPLDEQVLRSTLVEWMRDPKSGLPDGLANALLESGVAERTSSTMLCAYVVSVLKDSRKGQKWEAAGKNLPVLRLAKDSRLKATDAVVRLRANADLVTKAATAERRQQSSAARTELVSRLAEALDHARGAEDIPLQLERVDVGEMTTGALQKVRPPDRKRAPPKATSSEKPKVESKAPAKAARTRGKDAQRKQAVRQDVEDALAVAQPAREEALARSAGTLLRGPARSRSEAPLPSTPEKEVWSPAMHRREFGRAGGSVPEGLADVLMAVLSGGGAPVQWEVQGSPRQYLAKLPVTAVPRICPVELPQSLSIVYERWLSARVDVVTALMPDGAQTALLAFVGAPLTALGDRVLRDALIRLVKASAALYDAAASAEGERVPRGILNLDTAHLVARSGKTLVVISPLHPLWLGQVLSRFDAMMSAKAIEEEARRLLARSLSEAPAAPQEWPVGDGSHLRISRPEIGLLVYENEPSTVDPGTLEFVGERVASKYLEMLPHALFGLRVAVFGEGASHFVEGVAGAAERESGLRSIEVLYPGHSLNLAGKVTSELIRTGRLVLRPVPSTDAGPEFRPHIVARIVPPPLRPDDEQEGIPDVPILGAGSGLLPTEFQVSRSGLRARIPVEGHPVLERVEALHALARGRTPQRSFVSDATVTLLSSALSAPHVRGSWHVVVGRRLGRRPPPDTHLLCHERADEGEHYAAVADNINPLSRALESGFKKVGVNDLRPSMLRALATKLAAASASGLMSLTGAEDHLIAAGLLGLALRRECGRDSACVLAPIERVAAATLLGSEPTAFGGTIILAISGHGQRLRAIVGYASLGEQGGIDIARGQLAGPIPDQLKRLLAIVDLAAGPTSLGAVAAREALNWLLWPAIAAAELNTTDLSELVRGIGRDTEIVTQSLCIVRGGSALGRRGDLHLGGHPARIMNLDVSLFEQLVLSGQ